MARLDLTLNVSRRHGAHVVSLVETAGAREIAAHVVETSSLKRIQGIAARLSAAHRFGASLAAEIGEGIVKLLWGPGIEAALLGVSREGRVVLRLPGDTDLGCHIPWEAALLDHFEGTPICLAREFDLIRQIQRPSIDVQPAARNLRVLVAHADPATREYPSLAGALRELESVARALGSAECRSFSVETLPNATPASLKRSFQAHPPDIFHFIGHGIRRPTGGVLILESGETGKALTLYGEELASMARVAGTQLVVLSGCETAGRGADVATKLAEDGLPITLGMQLKVGDSSAHLFSRAFYGALAEGAPIEEAVAQGRAAIAGTAIDWASPVLYVDGPDRALTTPSAASPYFADLKAPRHNLPFDDTPFVGRREELGALKNQMLDPTQRLVTVTGMGGMGKTRLVRQVASDLVDVFPDGVWLIDCEGISGRDDLAGAVASAVGLGLATPTEQSLFGALRDRDLLLVFDSFERLVGQRGFLQKLLATTKELKVLVTSRTLLGLVQESEYSLHPLSLESRGSGLPDGVALFLAAAARTDPAFDRDPPDLRLVRSLVEGLEAVPLALILAAGRLRHFALRELAERVRTQRLQLLRRRGAGEEEKHTDLLGVVADSFEVLSEENREVARLLSVFHGGFYHEDAEEVIGESVDVLEGIATLRDHSLLITQAMAGRMRYRMLDTVREFVEQTLVSANLASAQRRHAERFAREAKRVTALGDEGKWTDASALLWLEAGNFGNAIQTSIELQDPGLICQFAANLSRPYLEAGRATEFERLCGASLPIASSQGDIRLHVELLGLQGSAYRRAGAMEDARRLWRERVEVSRKEGMVDAEADSLLDLADMALSAGETDLVVELLDRFDLLADALAPGPLRPSAQIMRALTDINRGEVERALEAAREVERATNEMPEDTRMLYVWLKLARVFGLAGQGGRAIGMCEKALRAALVEGFSHAGGVSLLELANVCSRMGLVGQAAAGIAAAEGAADMSSHSMALARDGTISLFYAQGGSAGMLAEARERADGANWTELTADLLLSVESPSR